MCNKWVPPEINIKGVNLFAVYYIYLSYIIIIMEMMKDACVIVNHMPQSFNTFYWDATTTVNGKMKDYWLTILPYVDRVLRYRYRSP